jgi:excisionase family DNA binding protein
MMTKLITIPKFAEATGLPYRLCLHLVGTGQIPSVAVGRRRRIDVRWVEQWLATGGYRSSVQEPPTQHREVARILNAGEPRSAAR